MPGSSLWLTPPQDNPLHKTLTTLITTSIPALYPIAIPPHFSPHVTLTADTIPNITNNQDAQQWLDSLTLPESVADLEVKVQGVQVGEVFFRKLTLACEKTDALGELAGACRLAGTGEGEMEVVRWAEGVYGPHLSLMYSDLPQEDINAKLVEVKDAIKKAKDEDAAALAAQGAEIWLVPTYKDIDDWQPVARRKLEGVRWSFET